MYIVRGGDSMFGDRKWRLMHFTLGRTLLILLRFDVLLFYYSDIFPIVEKIAFVEGWLGKVMA